MGRLAAAIFTLVGSTFADGIFLRIIAITACVYVVIDRIEILIHDSAQEDAQ